MGEEVKKMVDNSRAAHISEKISLLGIKQRKVAERTGIHETTLSQYLNGGVGVLSEEKIKRIEDFLANPFV